MGNSTKSSKFPIVIEMEPQANSDIEELMNSGKGLICDNVSVALEQLKAQGILPESVIPVFVVVASSDD